MEGLANIWEVPSSGVPLDEEPSQYSPNTSAALQSIVNDWKYPNHNYPHTIPAKRSLDANPDDSTPGQRQRQGYILPSNGSGHPSVPLGLSYDPSLLQHLPPHLMLHHPVQSEPDAFFFPEVGLVTQPEPHMSSLPSKASVHRAALPGPCVSSSQFTPQFKHVAQLGPTQPSSRSFPQNMHGFPNISPALSPTTFSWMPDNISGVIDVAEYKVAEGENVDEKGHGEGNKEFPETEDVLVAQAASEVERHLYAEMVFRTLFPDLRNTSILERISCRLNALATTNPDAEIPGKCTVFFYFFTWSLWLKSLSQHVLTTT